MQRYALWDHEQEFQALTGAWAGSREGARSRVLVSCRCSYEKAHWGHKLLNSSFSVVTYKAPACIWNTVCISLYSLTEINLRWKEWGGHNGLSRWSYERKSKVCFPQVRKSKSWERIWLISTGLPEEETLKEGGGEEKDLFEKKWQHWHNNTLIWENRQSIQVFSHSADGMIPSTCF